MKHSLTQDSTFVLDENIISLSSHPPYSDEASQYAQLILKTGG